MEIDREKQAQALAKAQQSIADAEKKREAVRVEKGVQTYLQGKKDALYSDELVENLASYILNKYITGEEEAAIMVLDALGKSLCSDTVAIRERALMIISVFCEIILEEDFEEFREVLSRILVAWLKFEKEYIAGIELVSSQLQKIILRMLYSGQWHELENLVIILDQIVTGTIAKSNLIRGISSKVHENLAEPDILDKLVNVYLDENDDRRLLAESLLMHLGRHSAMFLVQKMIYCDNKEDRFALISLIPKVGEVSIPVLTKCLEEEPPWFVIRNIVLIISRLGDPNLYSIAEPYLIHKDIRVQQQVVNCIEMLGGKQARKRLLQAMMTVNDELKGQLVIQLGQIDGKDVGLGFLDLLDQRHTFAGHVQDDLIHKLCIKVKFYPSLRAVDALQELISERRERYGKSDKIALAAATSLQAIEMKLNGDEDPDEEKGEMAFADEINEAIEEMVVDNEDSSIAAERLAESAEDELFSVEEMDGLSEGGEIVDGFDETVSDSEEHSGEAIPYYSSQDHHLMVWSKLYEPMTTEEVNELFAILKPVSFQANDEIVVQGEKLRDLYLIDSGFAGIAHAGEKCEIQLASLQAGEIIGSEGLIEAVSWSVSLRAQTDLQVRVLEYSNYLKLVKTFPEITQKIEDYCTRHDVVPHLINLTGGKAKESISNDITIRTHSLLYDSTGELVENEITGSLIHVVHGGYCFTLPSYHEDNPEIILGRQVSSEVEQSDGSTRKCFGVIAGAGIYEKKDPHLYVYVKFYHPFDSPEYSCKSLEIM
ncbi:MAG: cyclic nucleotide-binding domain-containing protein [Desulfobacterales bacterium]|nr:cyclic nucleotide-binding domain-containing protein [Desulfobacterales bacterium]